jgi:hypothetical protein
VLLQSKSRLSVIARLCLGLVLIYIVGYLIAWSIKTLIDAERVDKNYYVSVLFSSIISVFLLLYFLTLVLVHYFKVI